jgi:hypothetical protein
VILISSAWAAVLLFALTMCRLAARSDDSHSLALAERSATRYFAEHEDQPAGAPAERWLRRRASGA